MAKYVVTLQISHNIDVIVDVDDAEIKGLSEDRLETLLETVAREAATNDEVWPERIPDDLDSEFVNAELMPDDAKAKEDAADVETGGRFGQGCA